MEEQEEGADNESEKQKADEHYKAKLQEIKKKRFEFGDYSEFLPYQRYESKWTIEQWNVLFTQLLKASTFVEELVAGIHVCPVESLVLLVDYIRTSQKLNQVTIDYVPLQISASEIPENYRSKIDDILLAVRANPSIKNLTLHCLGNPQSIQHLLTGNESLETLKLRLWPYDYNQVSQPLETAISTGLRENNDLKEIDLFVHKARLDSIVSGLCHGDRDSSPSKKLESLSLWTEEPENNPELGPRVLEAIKCTPSLKTLNVQYDMVEDSLIKAHPWVDFILKNLHHPECSGLETLRLGFVVLGTTSHDGFNADTVTAVDDWMVPEDQANKTLKHVTFDLVGFAHARTVRLLCNLRGLKELNMTIYGTLYEDDDDDDEDDDNNNSGSAIGHDGNDREINVTDYWVELIQHCPELCTVFLNVESDYVGSRLFVSFLKGALGHGTLQSLTLHSVYFVQIDGEQLRSLITQLLRETSCLKHLSIHDMEPHDDLAAGLADGLRGNHSLDKLDIQVQYLNATNFRTVLESLLENQTLKELGCSSYDGQVYETLAVTGEEYCSTLSRLFQVNKSLCHIGFPPLNLQGQMNGLIEGLSQSTTLKSLDLGFCVMDRQGLITLGQALVENSTGLSLEHIKLPKCRINDATGLSLSDVKNFFRSIAKMRRLKTVNVGNYYWCLPHSWHYAHGDEDDEENNCLKLLLHATKENKSICSFGSQLDPVKDGHFKPLLLEIQYYLKLNRLGRHVLDSRNLRRGLWPAILVPMTTSKDEDADALFFFIREYFMRNSYPLRHQQKTEQHQQQGSHGRLSKRAKVGDEGGGGGG